MKKRVSFLGEQYEFETERTASRKKLDALLSVLRAILLQVRPIWLQADGGGIEVSDMDEAEDAVRYASDESGQTYDRELSESAWEIQPTRLRVAWQEQDTLSPEVLLEREAHERREESEPIRFLEEHGAVRFSQPHTFWYYLLGPSWRRIDP